MDRTLFFLTIVISIDFIEPHKLKVPRQHPQAVKKQQRDFSRHCLFCAFLKFSAALSVFSFSSDKFLHNPLQDSEASIPHTHRNCCLRSSLLYFSVLHLPYRKSEHHFRLFHWTEHLQPADLIPDQFFPDHSCLDHFYPDRSCPDHFTRIVFARIVFA